MLVVSHATFAVSGIAVVHPPSLYLYSVLVSFILPDSHFSYFHLSINFNCVSYFWVVLEHVVSIVLKRISKLAIIYIFKSDVLVIGFYYLESNKHCASTSEMHATDDPRFLQSMKVLVIECWGVVPISDFIRLAGMHSDHCASKEPKDPWE